MGCYLETGRLGSRKAPCALRSIRSKGARRLGPGVDGRELRDAHERHKEQRQLRVWLIARDQENAVELDGLAQRQPDEHRHEHRFPPAKPPTLAMRTGLTSFKRSV